MGSSWLSSSSSAQPALSRVVHLLVVLVCLEAVLPSQRVQVLLAGAAGPTAHSGAAGCHWMPLAAQAVQP
jgi:hypothetical protein